MSARDLAMRMAGASAVGLERLLGTRGAAAVGILTYHRSAPPVPGLPAPLHNVTPERMREQLRGLRAAGFRFWSLGRLLDTYARGETAPPQTAVVSFDDGYASVYEHAGPILRELSIPAVLFVATAFLDADAPFPFDTWGMAHAARAPESTWRPLRTAECDELVATGLFELGSHTHTHRDFRGRADDFAADLARSLGELETRFGAGRRPFAFPFGSPSRGFASEALLAAARASSVRCALTTESACVAPGSDPFGWGRFNVFPWDTGASLAAKLRGWYGWAPRSWQRLQRSMRPLVGERHAS